ncbi:MAG: hypothetical protein KKH98_02425 [Spirochaetes bacterium]|nr:hypothetical protein [Spirochaetota bacterium]
MFLLLIIIYKEKYLEDFLTTLVEVGVLNSVVISTQSLEEALPINVPIFAALKFTMEGGKPFTKVVLSLIDKEEIIHEINAHLLDSGIDITKEKIGEVLTIPISNAVGRKPYMEIK